MRQAIQSRIADSVAAVSNQIRMCGLGPRARQGHFLRTAASVIADAHRCMPRPGRGRLERHRDCATGSARDARPAAVGLLKVVRIASANTNAGKVQWCARNIG